MNEHEHEPAAAGSSRSGIETCNEALSLLLTALVLYRFTHPDGPEPRELARDLYRSGLERWQTWRRRRGGYAADLERIRNLPETEGPS